VGTSLRAIAAFLRGGRLKFTDFEYLIINAVAQKLTLEARDKLFARIRQFTIIYALDGGRELNCYQIVGGKPFLDSQFRLDDSLGESVLATFKVYGDIGTSNSGRLFLVDGRFFSIVFKEPTEHASCDNVHQIVVRISSSKRSLATERLRK
jgi:hypothetical protein